MLDIILYVILALVLLSAARFILGALIRAIASLFSALVSLAGTAVVISIVFLLVSQMLK